jgi:phage repressor protein C with HTH and peptisase S24 domain
MPHIDRSNVDLSLGLHFGIPAGSERRTVGEQFNDVAESFHDAQYCVSQYVLASENCEPQFMTDCEVKLGPYLLGLMNKKSDQNAVALRLMEARKAAGYETAKEFADKNDIPQSTYALHEGGKRSLNRDNTLNKYAELLGVRPAWLQFGEEPMKPTTTIANQNTRPSKVETAVATQNELGLRSDLGTAHFTGPRDLPILGYVKAGGLGFFITNGERQGVTVRPEPLLDVKDAYATYVHDESMVPKLDPGNLLFVHPTRPYKPGDLVVIQKHDGQAFIKQHVRRTEKALICKQYNPAGEVKYDPKEIKSVHLVVQVSFVDL